ncbi:MAG: hypothetical protein ACTSRG_23760 [Candidatus Helarchaeota archaeon]
MSSRSSSKPCASAQANDGEKVESPQTRRSGSAKPVSGCLKSHPTPAARDRRQARS